MTANPQKRLPVEDRSLGSFLGYNHRSSTKNTINFLNRGSWSRFPKITSEMAVSLAPGILDVLSNNNLFISGNDGSMGVNIEVLRGVSILFRSIISDEVCISGFNRSVLGFPVRGALKVLLSSFKMTIWIDPLLVFSYYLIVEIKSQGRVDRDVIVSVLREKGNLYLRSIFNVKLTTIRIRLIKNALMGVLGQKNGEESFL